MYRHGAGIVEDGGLLALLVEQLARVSMVLKLRRQSKDYRGLSVLLC